MGTKERPGDFDCYEHAEPDEPLFTLLARDLIAPEIVREWARRRLDRLHQRAGDAATVGEVLSELRQIEEARDCADAMQAWYDEHRR